MLTNTKLFFIPQLYNTANICDYRKHEMWRWRDSSGMGGRTVAVIRSIALSNVVGSRSQLFWAWYNLAP